MPFPKTALYSLKKTVFSVKTVPGPHNSTLFNILRPYPGAPVSNSQKVLNKNKICRKGVLE